MATRIEKQLHEWHNRAYGPDVDVPATFRKMCEEVGELGESLMKVGTAIPRSALHRERVQAACVEAADVAILLLTLIRGIEGNTESASLSSWIAHKAGILEERLAEEERQQEQAVREGTPAKKWSGDAP